jgi:DUF2934 family protein
MKRNLDQDTKRSPANPIDLDVEETIRRRAYALYEERGRGDGHELEDWVEAEAEVLRSVDIAASMKPRINTSNPSMEKAITSKNFPRTRPRPKIDAGFAA